MTGGRKMLNAHIASTPEAIDHLCEEAKRRLAQWEVSEHGFAIDLLLREFANNAMIHGNRRDAKKKIRVTLRVGSRYITILVRDEGAGFDWRSASKEIPEDTKTSGRGLVIGRLYGTQMKYNDAGNEVVLWLDRNRPDQRS